MKISISREEFQNKLRKYYFYQESKKNVKFQNKLKRYRKYLEVLRLASEGLGKIRISRITDIPSSTVQGWTSGKQMPALVFSVLNIPKCKLRRNYKWLPLCMKPRGKSCKFIGVPLKIKGYKDVEFVLNQLKPIKSDEMLKWEQRFGFISTEDAFAYLLGMIASDADKPHVSNFSRVCRLRLSKKYDWSFDLGEAVCYCLGRIGFRAWRYKDTPSFRGHPNGFYNWTSEASPFFNWIMMTCLGLEHNQLTSHDKINMDWLFLMPKRFCKMFLQGLFDGDGCVSVTGWYIANSCNPNQYFIINLLKIFGIKSVTKKDNIVISGKGSLINIIEFPVFRYSAGRLEKSRKLLKMLQNTNKQGKRNKNYKTIRRIKELHSCGFSPGKISEKIFDEFGIGIRPSSIRNTININSFHFS